MKSKKLFTVLMLVAAMAFAIVPAASANEVFNSSLSAPGVYWGTGNANSGWDVLTTTNSNDGSTLQLGLEIINRYIGPAPSTANDYYVAPSAGPLASWDVAFSVNSGTDPLSAYTYNLSIVNDNTSASYSFNPTLLPDNGQANGNTVVCKGCAYNGSNTGMQNAENLGFSFLSVPLGFDPSALDTYTFTLSAIPKAGVNVDPSVTVNAIVATPEPRMDAFIGIFVLGLCIIVARGRNGASSVRQS